MKKTDDFDRYAKQAEKAKKYTIIDDVHIPIPLPPQEKKENTITPVNPMKKAGRWSRIKAKFFDKFWPHKVVLIHMELNNGFHDYFVKKEKEGSFIYDDKMYIIDDKMKYYVLSAGLWCYDYHEGLSLPVRRKIDVNEVTDAVMASGIDHPIALNPSTLEKFLKSKIAEAIIKGAELNAVFRRLTLLTVLILIGVIGHIVLYMYREGMIGGK